MYLRADDRLDELRALPPVAAHLAEIHEILRHRSYVEVGFPCFAIAPLLKREFGDRLRLVHLVRHPVRVAASLVTHNWYQSARRDSLLMDAGGLLTALFFLTLCIIEIRKGRASR